MAIDANSTPAPERTLLRLTAAPGRLLPAARPAQKGAEVVRLDHSRRMRFDSAAEEFQRLSDQRDQIDARMRVLMDVLDPDRRVRGPKKVAPVALPKSGLVETAPGVLLFKAVRHDR